MSNLLELQGLPEEVAELAKKMATEGSCISLLSVSAGAISKAPAEQSRPPATKTAGTLGSCISILSVSLSRAD